MTFGRFVAGDRFNNKEKLYYVDNLVTQAVPCDRTRSFLWLLLDSCVDYNGSNLVLSRPSLVLSRELSRGSCWCFSGRSLQPWPLTALCCRHGNVGSAQIPAPARACVHTQMESRAHWLTLDDPHVNHNLYTKAFNKLTCMCNIMWGDDTNNTWASSAIPSWQSGTGALICLNPLSSYLFSVSREVWL